MRFVNLATKRGWRQVRRAQGYPVAELVREEYDEVNPVSGVRTKTETRKKVSVVVHHLTSSEVASSGGFLELGDMRISCYEQIRISDEIIYMDNRYKIIQINQNGNRYEAIVRRI
ncbi:MAG: hypothetical protein ACXQT6_05415 [Candidatus Methanospirareceae archaeon]